MPPSKDSKPKTTPKKVTKPKAKRTRKPKKNLDYDADTEYEKEMAKEITKECNKMIYNEVKAVCKSSGIKLPKGSYAEIIKIMGHQHTGNTD